VVEELVSARTQEREDVLEVRGRARRRTTDPPEVEQPSFALSRDWEAVWGMGGGKDLSVRSYVNLYPTAGCELCRDLGWRLGVVVERLLAEREVETAQ